MSASRPNEVELDADAVTAAVAAFRTDLDRLLSEIGRRLVGQTDVVGAVASALLAGGHVLVEGVPGLGKTLLVRTAAAAMELTFSRVQFTPDLMPADVIGTNLIVDDAGGRRFEFQKGPIFAHVVLADEINRATPKTQSALLEAMQEQSVTVGKQTYALPPPFFVLATQNPIEMEGTYPLPEAQLDRFLFKLRALPPSGAELHQILDRTTGAPEEATRVVLGRERLLEMRALVRQVPVARPIQDFVVRLVEATDPARSPLGEVTRFVRYGSSPRGAQALILGAKIEALRAGRFAPSFADVRRVAIPALRHRVLLNFDGEAEGITADALGRKAAGDAAGDAVTAVADNAARAGGAARADGPIGSRFDDRFLRKLESLALTIRRTTAGRSHGMRRSRRVGAGLEFADHRDYVPGRRSALPRLEPLRPARAPGAAALRGGRGPVDRRAGRRQRLDGDGATAQARSGAPDRRRARLRRPLQPRPRRGDGARRRGCRAATGARQGPHPADPPLSRRRSPTAADVDGRRWRQPCASSCRGGAAGGAGWWRSSPISTTRRGHAPRWSSSGATASKRSPFRSPPPTSWRPQLRGDLQLCDAETGEVRDLTISPRALADYAQRHAALLRELGGYCRERAIPCFTVSSDQPFDAVVLRMFRTGGLLG